MLREKIDFKPGDLLIAKENIRIGLWVDTWSKIALSLNNYYSTDHINFLKSGSVALFIRLEEKTDFTHERLILMLSDKMVYTFATNYTSLKKL